MIVTDRGQRLFPRAFELLQTTDARHTEQTDDKAGIQKMTTNLNSSPKVLFGLGTYDSVPKIDQWSAIHVRLRRDILPLWPSQPAMGGEGCPASTS